MKCDACGTESEFDSGFIREKKRKVCPGCWLKRRHRNAANWLWFSLAAGIVGWMVLWFDPASDLGGILQAIFLIQVFLIFTIVPHELGHAWAARVLGWRVFRIVLGVGKPLFSRKWLGVPFEVRLLPIGGVTFCSPIEVRHLRLKRFLVILAGPLTNVLMVLAVIVIWQGNLRAFDFWQLPELPRLFVWTNGLVLVVNLWPHQPKGAFGAPTDGKQLLQTLSFKKEFITELQATRFVLEGLACRERLDVAGAREWCDKGLGLYPQEFSLLNLSGINHLDAQRYAEARTVFLQLLAQESKPTGRRYLMLNNVAYAGALSRNPEWLPEADAFSNEAYAALPWVPAIVGTRGTVLVEMGQYPEGIKLLQEAFERADNAVSKGENAAHLAVAHAKNGDLAQGGRYLNLARQLNPSCALISRAESELGLFNQRT
jgi:hypothetical protein